MDTDESTNYTLVQAVEKEAGDAKARKHGVTNEKISNWKLELRYQANNFE